MAGRRRTFAETPGVEIDLDNREFQNLNNLIAHTRRSVFLTGKAGTGKSTFLRHITATTTKNFVVLAPTGIAAVNVGGQTIHSFFKLPLKPLLPDDVEFAPGRLRKRMKYSGRFIKLLNKLDLIIIDEISMVRADIIDFIDKLLRHYCHNQREPFAGKQMLFVGDLFQLEPVVTSDMRMMLNKHYPNPYFFSARAFMETPLVSIELRKVYRQDDDEFIAMLDRIRMGTLTPADRAAINSRVTPAAESSRPQGTSDSASGKMVMTLASRRDTVEAINEDRLKRIRRPLRTFTGVITGDFPDNNLPTPLELQLKEGAQVVFIKNDYDRRWVNGTVGRVSSCLPDRIEVTLENGNTYAVEPERWDNIVYEYDEKKHSVNENVIGSYTQYPVKLAWALTIHKSQGLTFSNMVIDMGSGAFTSGQTYVAMSRCRSLGGIELRAPLAERDVFVSRAIKDFSRSFNDDRALQQAIAESQRRERLVASVRLWESGDHAAAYDTFVSVLSEDPSVMSDPLVMRLARRKLTALTGSISSRMAALEADLAAKAERLATLADEYCELGYFCLDEGSDLVPALANFDKALSLVPDHIRAMTGRGRVLTEEGELHDAMEILLRARSLARTRSKAFAQGSREARAADAELCAIDRAINGVEARL